MFHKSRKEFVKKVMEIADIEGFGRADEIAQVVIKLFQVSVGEILSKEISESVPPDLKQGWDLIWRREDWGKIDRVEKRRDFVKKIMEISDITDFKRADEIAQVVLKLIQLSINESLSTKIAESVPPDLKTGWEMIRENELEENRDG